MGGLRYSRCEDCGEEFVVMDASKCARCLSVDYQIEDVEYDEQPPKQEPGAFPVKGPVAA